MSNPNRDEVRRYLATEIARKEGETMKAWQGVSRDTVIRRVDEEGNEIGPHLVVDHTRVGSSGALFQAFLENPEVLHRRYVQTLAVNHVDHVAATEISVDGDMIEASGEQVKLDPLTPIKIIGFFWRG